MLKFFFWTLLLANAALFAYGQGYLGSFKAAEREPARMKNQLAADRIVLVPAARAEAAALAVAAPPAPAPVAAAPSNLVACTEIGDFDAAGARRFEAQAAQLGLGEPGRINVPVTEINQYVVHIAPQGSRQAAERRAQELAARGITNYYIMPDTALRWGISLGVFKSEAAAQSLRDALVRQGVQGVRITGRGPTVNKVAFQFRDIAPALRDQLAALERGYRGIDLRTCK